MRKGFVLVAAVLVAIGAALFAKPQSSSGQEKAPLQPVTENVPHPHSAPTSNVSVQPVEKAPGANGYKVAAIFAQREQLSAKSVRVRGTVVKSTLEVMGKNFIHVRDTTGSAERGDNDLTITTMEAPRIGETVMFEGRVSIDKDFGAGYRYAVILEDAHFVSP